MLQPVLTCLQQAPATINAAAVLHHQMRRLSLSDILQMTEAIEAAITSGEAEIAAVSELEAHLINTAPSHGSPTGF